jgi:fibronectin type 3 domain-containing protein
VLVNPLPPSEPASPIATPSLGQAALSWTASAGATGYHVKRASSPGGPYVTLGSTNNTSYVDTTAVNGSTYYYVITAFNTGGESGDSVAVSAVIPYGLPFAENFEALSMSSLNEQHGWSAVDVMVQTNTVKTGAKAASITSGTGYLQHTFAGDDTNVWTDFVLQPVFFESAPNFSDSAGTVNFYFNTNGHPVVYNNTTPVELTTVTVTTGAWTRVTIKSDYASRKWDLYVNTAPVASNLAFYAAAPLVYTSIKVSGAGASSVALDDLSIGLLSPWALPLANKGTVILFLLQ